MTLLEKIYILQEMLAFSELSLDELSLIADVASVKTFSPGELIAAKGSALQKLYVVSEGSFVDTKKNAFPKVFDLRSLLFNLPLKDSIYASNDKGANSLCFAKKHIFALVYECPSFIASFLQPTTEKPLA